MYTNEEFCLGRNSPQLDIQYQSQTVSKRHVKFHCIVFDDGDEWGIEPLVYVEDLSTNGTYLQRAQAPAEDRLDLRGIRMDSRLRTSLLEEDDELWLTPERFLRYHVTTEFKSKDSPLTPEVKADMEASHIRFLIQAGILQF